MTYSEQLNATKSTYPFAKWRSYFPGPHNNFEGMEDYTPENCDKAEQILDTLIGQLIALGEHAPKTEKEKQFEQAVFALNSLNDATDGGLIETGEREDLCELLDTITVAAGLHPGDYADGEGIADEWREW